MHEQRPSENIFRRPLRAWKIMAGACCGRLQKHVRGKAAHPTTILRRVCRSKATHALPAVSVKKAV
ncbi:hypothetical protein [Kingella potus]|uniref:hypothetical protein n=1 Tax=Kingella potus TaxID=265175 RepID=UPI001FD1F1BB|nr:hypothetical protein [Kingella potus]UOP00242.1 hypothetical protein LVJ84_09960 [Kingella potus]